MTEETQSEIVVETNKAREKTYKREISIAIFFGCLFWSMWSGDIQFLEITFMPSLFNLGVVLGIHEWSTNIIGRK